MTHEELCRMEQSQLIKMIDEGKLVYLPCKRGDIVYFIKSAYSLACFPIKATMVSIRGINCDNEIMYTAITDYNKLDRKFTSNDIGKTVFLTLEEAEKALKELES